MQWMWQVKKSNIQAPVFSTAKSEDPHPINHGPYFVLEVPTMMALEFKHADPAKKKKKKKTKKKTFLHWAIELSRRSPFMKRSQLLHHDPTPMCAKATGLISSWDLNWHQACVSCAGKIRLTMSLFWPLPAQFLILTSILPGDLPADLISLAGAADDNKQLLHCDLAAPTHISHLTHSQLLHLTGNLQAYVWLFCTLEFVTFIRAEAIFIQIWTRKQSFF